MTLDEETKKYIDGLIVEHSIRVSSFLSALCDLLEKKNVITREDFETMLERSKNIASQAMTFGSINFLAFANSMQQMKKLKKELEEGLDRSSWRDLK